MWTIALFGTDEYYEPDGDSCVLLEDMGFTDPMLSSLWLKLDILGLPLHRKQIEGTQEFNNVSVHSKAQKKHYKIDIDDYVFPDDFDKVTALDDVLNHYFIYLYKGSFDFENHEIHPDGKCLMVAVTKSIEDIYENGITRVSLEVVAVNPLV